jgi:hypothetical protein
MIRDRSTSTQARVSPAASPHRRPAYAPARTRARYCSGTSSTRRSTSSCDKNLGSFARSDGNGTSAAGFTAIRRSAIAAASHCRGEHRLSHRCRRETARQHLSDPHSDRAVRDLGQRGRPELGKHLIVQRRRQPRMRRDSQIVPGEESVSRPHRQPDFTTPRVRPRPARQFQLDLGLTPLGIHQATLGLAVRPDCQGAIPGPCSASPSARVRTCPAAPSRADRSRRRSAPRRTATRVSSLRCGPLGGGSHLKSVLRTSF